MRPCELPVETTAGVFTPSDINALASSVAGLCRVIMELNSIDEVKELCVAVEDNWKRFMESA